MLKVSDTSLSTGAARWDFGIGARVRQGVRALQGAPAQRGDAARARRVDRRDDHHWRSQIPLPLSSSLLSPIAGCTHIVFYFILVYKN